MALQRVRLGISRCLLGDQVRYDRGHKHDRFLTTTLGQHVEWVAVCPEIEIGLGVPREPIQLREGLEGAGVRLLTTTTGRDLTDDMEAFAAVRSAQLGELDGFVFKSGSPSCGLFRVPVRSLDGARSRRDGRGVFAAAITEQHPLLPVEEEGRLNDPVLRETFIDRVFAHHRWREFVAAGASAGDLVAFHARHKMTLLSHDPARYRDLGRLVAQAGDRDVVDEYGRLFAATLQVPTTRGKHLNVLQHLQGYLRDALDGDDRVELDEVLHAYRTGLVPLIVPVTLLRHHFRRHPHPWVAEQVYLEPYPAELLLRNHV